MVSMATSMQAVFVSPSSEHTGAAAATIAEVYQRSNTKQTDLNKSIKQVIAMNKSKIRIIEHEKVKLDLVNLQINANLGQLILKLSTGKYSLSDVNIKGLKVHIQISTMKTLLVTSLQGIKIYDPRPDVLYSKILTCDGDDMLEFNMVVYNKAATVKNKQDIENTCDLDINLKMACVKFIFINKFIKDLTLYGAEFSVLGSTEKLANQAQAMKAQAQIAATENRGSRIRITIDIQAPVIVVPRHSQSPHVIVADLGKLEIRNKFQVQMNSNLTNIIDDITDSMEVALTNLTLSRSVNNSKDHNSLILDKVTLRVIVNRSLMKLNSTILINADVDQLNIRLSNGDFTLLMAILSENMAERADMQTSIETNNRKPSEVGQQVSEDKDFVAIPEDTQETIENSASLSFNFQLNKIVMVLQKGDMKKYGNSPSDLIGSFELRTVKVHVNMMPNGMSASVSLDNCVLDDLRPGHDNSIKRMMKRNDEYDENTKKKVMIYLRYVQDAEGNLDIKVRIQSIFLCMCPDFLLDVSSTMIIESASTAPTAAAGTANVQPIKQVTVKSPTIPVEVTKVDNTSLLFDLNMVSPEIYLFDDQNNVNTRVLLVKMNLHAVVQKTPTVQIIKAEIGDFDIVKCIYNVNKRKNMFPTSVLSPIDIYMQMNTPIDGGMHVAVNIQNNIIFNISPSVVSILTSTMAKYSAQYNNKNNALKDEVFMPGMIWKPVEVDFTNLPCLRPEVCEDALDSISQLNMADNKNGRDEEMFVIMKKMILMLETGDEERPVPLVVCEMTFNEFKVKNWSDKLSMRMDAQIEIAYCNENVAVWEPVLERVQDETFEYHRPYGFSIEINTPEPEVGEDDESNTETVNAERVLKLISTDILQITVTKVAINVVTRLLKMFSESNQSNKSNKRISVDMLDTSVQTPQDPSHVENRSSFVVNNATGLELSVMFDSSIEVPTNVKSNIAGVILGIAKTISTSDRPSHHKQLAMKSVIQTTQDDHMKILNIMVNQNKATLELRIIRAEKRVFQIVDKSYPTGKWDLVVETKASFGRRDVNFRSIFQVRNHLPFDIDLFSSQKDIDHASRCGRIQSHGGRYYIPVDFTYTKNKSILFRPVDKGNYKVSEQGFAWMKMVDSGRDIILKSVNTSQNCIMIKGSIEVEMIASNNSSDRSFPIYTLHLHPCIMLHNKLPFPIEYKIDNEKEFKKISCGGQEPLLSVELGLSSIQLKFKYNKKMWTGTRALDESYVTSATDQMTTCIFTDVNNSSNLMELCFHSSDGYGFENLTLYSSYWLINKTQRNLSYKSNDDIVYEHLATDDSIVLFNFKAVKLLSSAKKISLKIGDSDWSDRFSLDVVGNSGTIECKMSKKKQQVGINISLSSFGLSKIIDFTPFYLIINESCHQIECLEVTKKGSNALWISVPPKKCIPFWPEYDEGILMIRTKQSKDTAASGGTRFSYVNAHQTLIPLDNEYGGIGVEVLEMETTTKIVFQNYSTGLIPVLILNNTTIADFKFGQIDNNENIRVEPGKQVFYTWRNPCSKREITWTCGKELNHIDALLKPGANDFFYDDVNKLYWVSFLNGLQRILLITDDIFKYIQAMNAGELEKLEQKYEIFLHGVGISIVNNDSSMSQGKEISYISISSSGVIWEEKKRRRFKPMKTHQSDIIEKAYEVYLREFSVNQNAAKTRVLPNSRIEVKFSNNKYEPMWMLKPTRCLIRRNFQEGLYVDYSHSKHHIQIHSIIHKLQIDNQLADAVFPVVFSPVPPPKSVAIDSAPKPFLEFSTIIMSREFTEVKQLKYTKLLIQEIELKIDQPFLHGIMAMFTTTDDTTSGSEQSMYKRNKDKFEIDMKVSNQKLCEIDSSHQQKHFYDFLHFSPLKIHLSFSMYQADVQSTVGTSTAPVSSKSALNNSRNQQDHQNIIQVFLQSVGIVLTDIQDVIFKLGYFERKFCFYSNADLIDQLTKHYTQQAVKQMYVLVFGLDVIGNPYGVVRGLASGIEDLFYEPYQGIVQGPEEFAEGLVLGVRSLVKHAVGGAAGAASRIAGTLGKGVAALTMDSDYQKRRQEDLSKRPQDLGEGLARGGRGLVYGLYDGVTGIVRKPVEGAKKEGVEGFFKGIGKGLVGVVTRPASGVIDFASYSFDGIRRVTDNITESRRHRPPRLIGIDGVIKPYTRSDAEGLDFMRNVERGQILNTDAYLTHMFIDTSNLLLVTNRRVVFLMRNDILGQWNTEWSYFWSELSRTPTLEGHKMEFLLKKKERHLFKANSYGKAISVTDIRKAEQTIAKMKSAMEQSRFSDN